MIYNKKTIKNSFKIATLLVLLPFMFIIAGCGSKKEVLEVNPIIHETPASEFEYTTAREKYGEAQAKVAVDRGDITEEDSIILLKYKGTDEDVVVPEYIDGHPVEIIDNYCFSPFNDGDENNEGLWNSIIKESGVSYPGNGSSKGLVNDFAGGYFNAFIDACVSTDYTEEPIKGTLNTTGKLYDPAQHYIYYQDDYEKAVSYLRNHKPFSHIHSVILPTNTRAIGGCAFLFCDNMVKVECNTTQVQTNDFAFAFCTKLKESRLSLTADTDACFLGDISLERAWNFGHHIGAIEYACCPSLRFVSIGRNMKYAKAKAFYRTPSLKSCYFPLLFKITPDFVDFNTFTAILSRDDGSYKAFKENGWPFRYR